MDYSKLSDRELDALVAERVMGYEAVTQPSQWARTRKWWKRADGCLYEREGTNAWSPSTDDNAARLVRDRIAELKLVRQYRTYLAMQIWPEDTPYEQFKGADEFAFLFEQATPRQQATAALQALDAAKENPKHE